MYAFMYTKKPYNLGNTEMQSFAWLSLLEDACCKKRKKKKSMLWTTIRNTDIEF